MKLTIWGLITLAAVSGASPAIESASSDSFGRQEDSRCTDAGKIAETDRLLFKVNLDTFTKARDARDPSCLDWSSDGCSYSPDRPWGFDFKPSCRRHDFGYRNAKAQKRCSHDLRKRIDDNFKEDLKEHCSKVHGFGGTIKRANCRRLANEYYEGVRKLGREACGPA